jgi:dTDP-4-amino-4,6-dideoxygalactose transaminase
MEIPFLNFGPVHDMLKPELTQAFERVLARNQFVLGEELELFEQSYADFNNVNHAIGVSNGLDALFLSLTALGIGSGDEVIMPSNTFIATVLSVSYTGAKPVFVEPQRNTYLIDSELIVDSITSRTKAIIPVHLYGQACNMNEILAVADKYGLMIVEDNAQAHGASFKGRLTGSFGHVNATSFYPGKNLGALGDGGAITTNSLNLSKKVQELRNYGSNEKYKHNIIGYNMRLDELQAAFLNVKLKRLNEWTVQRQQIAALYYEGLQHVEGLVLPEVAEGATHVYHLFVVRTKWRDELQRYLRDNGVITLIHYPTPPHLQKAYINLGYVRGDFPIAEEIASTALSLPIWPGMNTIMVQSTVQKINAFFKDIK